MTRSSMVRPPGRSGGWFSCPRPRHASPGVSLAGELCVCAGTTELCIGLCLLCGFFPRTIVMTAWLFINMTLTIFDRVELAGHLPLYGVMGVLLI